MASAAELNECRGTMQQLGIGIETLLLAGFASLLYRLNGASRFSILSDSHVELSFDLDEASNFSDAVSQAGRGLQTHAEKLRAGGNAHDVEFETSKESHRDEPQLRVRLTEGGGLLALYDLSGEGNAWHLDQWKSSLLFLMKAAGSHAGTPILELPLWPEAEARAFYARLNETSVAFPDPHTVQGRFDLEASRHPESLAVVSPSGQLTYKELEIRSKQLAQRLIGLGAGANRPIGVCMERSLEMTVVLLAVLRTGSCYVPLDPSAPIQRLESILEECNPFATIVDKATMDCVLRATAVDQSTARRMEVIEIANLEAIEPLSDAERTQRAAELGLGDSESLESASLAAASSLAYILYTSGSTGKPKGVPITHAALFNLLCSMSQQCGIENRDRMLAVAPIFFDIATMDMFLPICSGGTLVIASSRDAVDPYRLAQLLTEQDITWMQATPTTWRMMVTSGWRGKRGLKMISGGEPMARELANDLLERGDQLWNCYGPTETTIYSSAIRIAERSGAVALGPPIANTSFYVVDRAGQLVPPGFPGELLIGGVGVSPGYLNRSELTARRFLPDRFGPVHEKAGTLFASGDLMQMTDVSRFEFLGRADQQIKLRGFRIELGEIESVLRSYPAIADAVTLLREDTPGEPRLAAYVLGNGQPLRAEALRQHLAHALPEYMLPSVFVVLDGFPQTANGKTDRRKLPVPESSPGLLALEPSLTRAPADALETQLLQIFREVLGNKKLGVTDSFFRYGGYSLLTVRLFSRIDQELGVQLPISLLFDAPTVQELARVLRKEIFPSAIVPIRPHGRLTPVFLIQSYLLYHAILEIVEPARPVFGVRELNEERLSISLEERAGKFAREIVRVQPTGRILLAGWCAAGTLTVEIARQLRAGGHEVGLVALFDSECPGFKLPEGVRAKTTRLRRKASFHLSRMRYFSWRKKFTYIAEAIRRNWDWAVESYYSAHYQTMLWLQRRLRLALSEAAFNNVYASISGIGDVPVQPYEGKLHLFRAADIPDFAETDATLGWSKVALEGVEVRFVPGDHVSMFQKPHNASLARRLQHDLQAADPIGFAQRTDRSPEEG